MPQGLAPVTARRVRSLQRHRARVLVGLLAALIATLAPVESPVPLGPFEGIVGQVPAEAQTAITLGTPVPCNPPWLEDPDGIDESLCVLILKPACPEHPLDPGSYLTASTEFPDFCEATVLESVDSAMYAACTALTGYVIKTFMQGSDQACRMIRPTECALKMHRTGVNTCRRVQRRSWKCPSGATPTNQFNHCYQQPPDYTGAHPACQSGAPSFAISTCEEYVGQDFVRAPASVQCSSFDTGNTGPKLRDLTSASNLYWCQFDSSYLDAGCHGAGTPCPAADAVCVKRASTTGGCNAIAQTIKCRGLQADYLASSRTAEDAENVYLQGCTPCVVLPFSPIPLACPQDLRTDPPLSKEVNRELTHQRRYDWTGSVKHPRPSLCSDPRQGLLVWESSHHSGLAVVNSPVVLRVGDLQVTPRQFEYIRTDVRHRGVPLRLTARFWPTSRLYFVYADGASGDPIVRSWPTFDPTLTYGSVDEIVDDHGPCLIRDLPDFRVRVEELWPDTDASDIQALFGSGALDWWTTGLNDAQRRSRTEARGLNYVDSTTSATERAAELARRANSLTQIVRCNYGVDVWCNWRPARPGYYRLVAAGAWNLQGLQYSRHWHTPEWWAVIDAALMDMYRTRDGNCPNPQISVHTDHDCLKANLASMGLTAEQAGLKPDLDGLLPMGSSEEWLYSVDAGPNVRCPPRDMRVYCGGGTTSWNYTESEPIGIVVHEVRVSTVTPDG